ncbi:MAG: M28 family peptidase [Clostridiales bacterium]|jgi:hypothetical protein|nr:M28 family peptidase [Clostridiales bacterium]
MKPNRTRLLFSIILIISIGITVKMTLAPSAIAENAPSTEFSAIRAFKHIEAIAKEPRLTGTESIKKAREYVISELNEIGIEAEVHKSNSLENIYGIIEGTNSSDAIMLTAHLDTVYNSPGAADDGSGIAVLLETARALKSNAPYKNTIILLFTDGEELWVRGAMEFIRNSSIRDRVKIVVGFDAGGLSGPSILTSTSENNGWLISQLAKAYPSTLASSMINIFANSTTDYTLAFRPAGYSGYEFDINMDKRHHSRDDNIDNLNPNSVQDHGNHALALADHFGDLDSLDDPREENVVYFSFLRLFIISYPIIFGYILAIILLCMFIKLLYDSIKNKLITLGGILYGAFVCLMALGLAFLLGISLNKLLKIELFMKLNKSLAESYQAITFMIITLAFIICWYAISLKIRKTSPYDMTMGILIPLLIVMLVTSIAFPDIGFAFSWPILFSLLACMNWIYKIKKKKKFISVKVGFLLSGIAIISFVGPYVFMGLHSDISITLVFTALICGYIYPYILTMLGMDNWIEIV